MKTKTSDSPNWAVFTYKFPVDCGAIKAGIIKVERQFVNTIKDFDLVMKYHAVKTGAIEYKQIGDPYESNS
jgi:hypothetical protein